MERSARFELVSKLGEGGMGVVYEARDQHRKMTVALKVLHRLDASSLYQFKREFRAIVDLSHPNIVTLYDLVAEKDDWYLSMELVHGSDFINYVRGTGPLPPLPNTPSAIGAPTDATLDTRVVHPVSRQSSSGDVPLITVAPGELVHLSEIVNLERLEKCLRQLAQALYALHSRSMVHRDLKPSNVRVTPQGRAVLMDFGIVADTEDGDKESAKAVGTPMYMAPEQADGAMPSAAADWYAFGVLLYQALAGRLPFRGPTDKVLALKREGDPPPPSTFTSGIPEDLEALCMELLSRNPEDRPQGYDVLTRLGLGAERLSRLMSEVTFIGTDAFVGRTRHLEELGNALSEARKGKAVCVLAEGASGMGKTTLLRRFVLEMGAIQGDKAPPLILSGRCHERETLSYKAFDGIIDGISRELLNQPADRVDRLLPDDIDLVTRLFPVLRRIPGVQVARPMGGRNPLELRARAIEALRTLLDRMGAQWHPVVMRIEDLQWADSDSLDLLAELLRTPAPRRLLILVSLRTESAVSEQPVAHASVHDLVENLSKEISVYRIDVGPLNRTEQALLVAKLAGPGSFSPTLDDDFWSEADGNPLLLTELARFAAEAPELVRTSRKPQLEDVISRRVARLTESARSLLEIVAVAGEPTPLGLLADAIGMSDEDRERDSSALRVAKLARVALPGREPWLNTQHEKIRETVVAALPADRLRLLHHRLARALELWDSASVSSLARHWLAAGDRDQAAKFLIKAARGAAEKLAHDRAAELYRVTLDLITESPGAERVAVLEPLGHALELGGRYYEAAQAYSQGAGLADKERSIELERRAADNLLRSGRIREGMQKLAKVMKDLGLPLARTRNRSVISLFLRRAGVAVRGLKYTEREEAEIPARELSRIDALYAAATSLGMVDQLQGTAVQAQHIKEALRAGETHRVCRALAIEVSYLGTMAGKQTQRADELGRDVLLRARKLNNPFLIGLARLGAGVTDFFAGRMRSASQSFAEGQESLKGVSGAEWERMTCLYFLCLSLINTGQWSDLQRQVKRAIDKADQRHDMYASNLFKSEPSTWCSLIANQPDEAHSNLDAALRGWPQQPFYIAHYQVGLSRALVYLYQGEGAKAANALDDLEPHLSGILLNHIPLMISELTAYRGRAALLAGDLSTARKMIKRMAKLESPGVPALTALIEAPMRQREGNQQEAERLISAALDAFSDLDAPHLEAACQYQLGQMLGGKQGDELIKRGLGWFEERKVVAPTRMIAALTWHPPRADE